MTYTQIFKTLAGARKRATFENAHCDGRYRFLVLRTVAEGGWRIQRENRIPTAAAHPLNVLRHHVTGAIERGEATAIIALTTEPTEPTEQGNQYVIPGCEKDKSRGPKQIDLF